MLVRPATSEDISTIVGVQQKNPQAADWQESDYVRLAEDPSGVLLVAEDAARQILGFAAARRVFDEAELQNLAVDPQHRRKGVGQGLVHEVHCRLRAVGTKRVFLEVRPSNESPWRSTSPRATPLSAGARITTRRLRKTLLFFPLPLAGSRGESHVARPILDIGRLERLATGAHRVHLRNRMEDSHVESLVGNRQRKRFGPQHR